MGRSFQSTLRSFVTVLLQVRHERGASRSDCMRILRIRLRLMKDVSRSVLQVEGTKLFQRFGARVVDGRERRCAATLHKRPHGRSELERLDEGAVGRRHVGPHLLEIETESVLLVRNAQHRIERRNNGALCPGLAAKLLRTAAIY